MRKLCAADLMNSEVLTVHEEMTLGDLADYLTGNEISGAPVVDEEGRVVGVVSLVDLVAASRDRDVASTGSPEFYLHDRPARYSREELREHPDYDETTTVAEIMTPSVYSVEEDARVSEVAALMLRAHLHRVMVTRDGELVGIISTSDLLGLLLEEN
jgi:CBS domain-containing protein